MLNIFQRLLHKPVIERCACNKFSSTFLLIRKYSKNCTSDEELENREYENLLDASLKHQDHGCLIIHPYVKWGPKKDSSASQQKQIQEAVSLVDTLGTWRVHEKLAVPLLTLDKKQLFGLGALASIRNRVRSDRRITAVFINLGTLKPMQQAELQMSLGVPVLDRYAMVMQILKRNATSKQARLQVALAEIPYVRARVRYSEYDPNTLIMLDRRERALREQLAELREHRELLRAKRRKARQLDDCPVVAIVGYTNAGKTALTKALTGDETLRPEDGVFATLDVTVHRGILPSGLRVLYVDTVGFMSHLPTALIECFVATLEDVLLADVILHVSDLSDTEVEEKCAHVRDTLCSMAERWGIQDLEENIVTVGNKIDMLAEGIKPSIDCNLMVSAVHMTGIDVLRQAIEDAVIRATGKKTITIRLPTGGDEIRWMYKNANVIEQVADPENYQFQYVTVIISEAKLNQFHHYFIKEL